MNTTVITSPFSACNPYETSYIGSILGQKKRVDIEKKDPVIRLVDRIIQIAQDYLFANYEKRVNFTGQTARILNASIFWTILGTETATIANELLNLKLEKIPYLSYVPGIIRYLSLPFSIFFLAMGVIQGFVELVNLRRVSSLLRHVQNLKKEPMEALEWIKAQYFSLNQEEVQKVQIYIEKWLPALSKNEKKERFNQIAKKMLQLKFENLERRITPGLAKEVSDQLALVLSDLKSYNPLTRNRAQLRTQALMASINTQAKNKIIVHILALIVFTTSVIHILASTFSVVGLPFLIAVSIEIVAFIVIKAFIEHGHVAKAVENLYDNLAKLNLIEEVS